MVLLASSAAVKIGMRSPDGGSESDSIIHVMRLTAVIGVVLALILAPARSAQGGSRTGAAATAAPAAVFNRYCVSCHNARLKTAGVVIDPAALDQPGPER